MKTAAAEPLRRRAATLSRVFDSRFSEPPPIFENAATASSPVASEGGCRLLRQLFADTMPPASPPAEPPVSRSFSRRRRQVA